MQLWAGRVLRLEGWIANAGGGPLCDHEHAGKICDPEAMGRRRRSQKERKMARPDPRRWTTRLAAPVPPGPAGQPGHDAGAAVTVSHLVSLPEVGNLSMSVPRASALLLRPALAHLQRAVRLRRQLPNQVVRGKWVQPGHEFGFSNETLVFDFFEEAMAGVVLAHTAVDNFANECLPQDFEYLDEKGIRHSRELVERTFGLEKRLSRVVSQATGRPNLQADNHRLWERVMELKSLRDDIGHAKLERTYSGPDPSSRVEETIYGRLLATDLLEHHRTVVAVAEHYGMSLD